MQRGEQREADLLGGEEVAGGEQGACGHQDAVLELQLSMVLFGH